MLKYGFFLPLPHLWEVLTHYDFSFSCSFYWAKGRYNAHILLLNVTREGLQCKAQMINSLRKGIITGNLWMDSLSWEEVFFEIYKVNSSTLF